MGKLKLLDIVLLTMHSIASYYNTVTLQSPLTLYNNIASCYSTSKAIKLKILLVILNFYYVRSYVAS